MRRFLSLLCMLLFCIGTYAQRITVSGKVTAGGEGLPGVTVTVKGSTSGTITSWTVIILSKPIRTAHWSFHSLVTNHKKSQ